ncbi:O-antigen ligase [Commensalibacter sp. ESL0382]|uniref:O-antigen ligase family protein n=1 Tax=Commensalibacter sp. ESL0382 TaxID=2676445 RepID=UPI0012D94B21|nr:O-antigen ligase family protein [Commensalibacter sp. ESL0382]MUG33987.1 hypothetical protein [Commensalibacter sp. ESL0382]
MESVRKFLNKSTLFAVLILPVFLTHLRGIADGLISYIAICFVIYSFINKQWDWGKQNWVIIAFLWWGWILLCTIPFGLFQYNIMMIQAVVLIRFIFFAAALQVWVLTDEKYRRWLSYVLIACATYIILNMLCQLITGYNIVGAPRYFDGTLTGPYHHPRAAGPLARLLLPITLSLSIYCIYRLKGWRGNLVALFIILFAILMMAFAGQRMPFILFVFGIVVSLYWLRPLRTIVLSMLICIPLILGATSFLSPKSYHHLVTLFIHQMAHFSSDNYGLIYTRAMIMGLSNPWTGLGYDAYRHFCANPIYFHGLSFWGIAIGHGDGKGAEICLPHPHNHYIEMFVNAGIPGLILFCYMVFLWWVNLVKGLTSKLLSLKDAVKNSWRVGLFAAVLVHEWPFAAGGSFGNLPLGGWFFLLLGLGLSYSWDYGNHKAALKVDNGIGS